MTAAMAASDEPLQPVRAWQCIGCGSIEAPQTCIGICQHRKVEFVYAVEHRRVLARVRDHAARCETLVRQLAYATPRQDEWERSYRSLQERARALLAGREGDPP